ncbi:MAG TPA: DUF6506 family protein [Patescibacteria group bacterium]|nr:DUF6506 family protein [Patescibacteria group bacterium]
MLKAAFVFIAPKADGRQHRSVIATPEVELTTVGVGDYAAAAVVVKELVNQGVVAVELCGGFGIHGVAAVKEAAQGNAAVGVVRFDCHPGLGGKSGDELF